MKKTIVASVLASSVFLPLVVNAQEEELPVNMVVSQKADVHKGATSLYPTVSTLNAGQKVKVIDEFTNSSGEHWYRLDLGKVKGWTLSTKLTNSQVENSAKEAQIQGTNINIRKGPGTSYPVVTKLSNKTVKVLSNSKNKQGELWYEIQYGNKKGWVISTFVKFSNTSTAINSSTQSTSTKTVTTKKATVRKGATSNYKVVSTLKKGQKVKVIDSFTHKSGETWYRVDLGKIKGWVIESAFNTSSASTSEKVTYKTIQVSKTTVRKGATSNYKAVSTLTKGQKVKVIDTFNHKSGETWYRVDLGKNKGWVIESAFNTSSASASEKATYKTIQVSKTAVRKGASTSYSTVGHVSKNQKVSVIDSHKHKNGEVWYRLDLGKYKGWVIGSAFEVPSTSPISKQTLYVSTKNTYLYKGASLSYQTVQKLPKDSKVTVIGEFTNSSTKEKWLRVQTSNGKVGWTPEIELTKSKNGLKTVYALDNAVIRKGASSKYAVSIKLVENDSLLVLRELNGWLNVENSKGRRGLIEKDQTSTTSLKRLISPTLLNEKDSSTLVWEKPMNFNFTYKTLAGNKLQLSQGITDVQLPDFKVKGIKNIEILKTSSNEKSVLLTMEPGYTFTIRNLKDKVTIKVIATGLVGKKIVIDPGHGGKDPGAIGPTGLYEKDVTLNTALLLKTELENSGAIVTLTRNKDVYLELAERTAISNASDHDAFISIHTDSFSRSSNGTTSFYNTTVNFNGPKSKQLGLAIQKELVDSLDTYNRGVKEQDFYVNRMNELPSVLVELAFISNPKEEELLKSKSFRLKAVTGIKNGLEDYFSSF